MIRVALLAQKERLLCQVLASLIDQQPDMTAVGTYTCTSRGDLSAATADVLVVDGWALDHPAGEDIGGGRAGISVIFLTSPDDTPVRPASGAEAALCLAKSTDVAEVLEAIRLVGRGERWGNSQLTAQQIRSRARSGDDRLELSGREQDIVDCLVQGRTNREIARELGLAEKTVKNYVSSILSKLGVRDRTQAAVRCATKGLVSEAAWNAVSS